MSKKVEVKYHILVRGYIGGSFDMDAKEYAKLRAQWEKRGNRFGETELAHEVIDWSRMGFDHLNIDEMEIEEFDAAPSP